MKVLLGLLLAGVMAISAWAQSPSFSQSQTAEFDSKHRPLFEDYPVTENWDQPPAPLKLATRSERMFRTQFTNAAKEKPNFAGRYRFTIFGCGSGCAAGAVIDLGTGQVFQPPLATTNGAGWGHWIISPSMFNDADIKFHESRLVIVLTEQLGANGPDTYYFVWERDHFRQLLHVSGKQ